MKITHQYHSNNRFVAVNSGKRHPAFDNNKPLSVHEMYSRALSGLPLSAPIPPSDRIPINDKFFVDSFDVLDAAIRNNFRLSEEEKQKQRLAAEQLAKDKADFEKWKLEQQKLHVIDTSPQS